jgi:hypothetical protein
MKATQRLTLGITIFCFGLVALQLNADTLDVWNLRNPHLSLGMHRTINYVNGQFVAFGPPAAGLATSNDGTNWAVIPLPFDGSQINQIAYGNGQYIAAAGSLLASSLDLTNWTYSTNPPQTTLNAIAFGNGAFVAVGSNLTSSVTLSAFAFRSTDGVNWTQSTIPTNNLPYNALYEITYGNGHFVATEYTLGRILVSADGISWTATPTVSNEYLRFISFANGRFYAAGYANVGSNYAALVYSTDGSTWSFAPDPRFATSGAPQPFHAVSGNGLLLATASPAPTPLAISTDGANFVSFAPNNFSNSFPIAFGNGLFANSWLQVSADGTNWSASPVPPTNNLPYIVDDIFTGTNGYIAFCHPNEPLLASPNGLQFSFTTNVVPTYQRVKYANGLYHAVGQGGSLGRSTNGLDWVTRNPATLNPLRDIEYGNSTWVAVGANGTITTSPTGNAWTLRFSGTSLNLNGIAYGDNQFVAVGQDGTVMTSPDAITWTAQYSGTQENLLGITFANGQFVAVSADVLTSPDGVNWTVHNSGVQLLDLNAIAFGEGTFCAVGRGGGLTNVILTSTDGVSWTQRIPDALKSMFGNSAGVRFLNGTFFMFSDTYILQSGPVTPVQLGINFASNSPQISVQASSNLLLKLQWAGALTGPWQDCGLFTNPPSGNFTFPDASASGQSPRFYRAAAP